MTIKEVADLAKVSITTVSRVLNNDETLKVNPKTRDRILEAVKKTGYKKKKINSKKIRYKVALIRIYNKETELEDVYYVTLRRNLETLLDGEGIKYDIFDIDEILKKGMEINLKFYDAILTIGGSNLEIIKDIYKMNPQIICIDAHSKIEGIDFVKFDSRKAIEKVFKYIQDLGHKNIGLLYGKSRKNSENEVDFRYEFFKEILEKHNLYNKNFFIEGEMTSDSGYKMMRVLLSKEKRPTIVFCANDSIAIGAYKAIHKKGLTIPDDISIIGFNDLKVSKYMIPSLTTIKINLEDMADSAVTLLKEKIYFYRKYSKSVELETKLIIRKSCNKLKV